MRRWIAALSIVAVVGFFMATPVAEAAACYTCENVFNSWFCFPGYPGRTECVDTPTHCAMSGAFCDIIVVDD